MESVQSTTRSTRSIRSENVNQYIRRYVFIALKTANGPFFSSWPYYVFVITLGYNLYTCVMTDTYDVKDN